MIMAVMSKKDDEEDDGNGDDDDVKNDADKYDFDNDGVDDVDKSGKSMIARAVALHVANI